MFFFIYYIIITCFHYIGKDPCVCSKCWHVISELNLPQTMTLKKQSTTPTSGNYFRTSWKLITTHSNNSWNCGILKQIIIISIVFNDVKYNIKCQMQFLLFDRIVKAQTKKDNFYMKSDNASYKVYFGQRFHRPIKLQNITLNSYIIIIKIITGCVISVYFMNNTFYLNKENWSTRVNTIHLYMLVHIIFFHGPFLIRRWNR